jgi:[CysO sulfur-carrier protein]-S-L-cysteine hydrolase
VTEIRYKHSIYSPKKLLEINVVLHEEKIIPSLNLNCVVTLPRKLIITKKHIEDLRKYSLSHVPIEACSLLMGVVKNRLFIVRENYHMKNLDGSNNSFKMGGTDLITAYQYALENKLDVIGIYHSHISGVRPSMKDMEYMEINPVVWLIYSVSDRKFGAYILENLLKDILIEVVME